MQGCAQVKLARQLQLRFSCSEERLKQFFTWAANQGRPSSSSSPDKSDLEGNAISLPGARRQHNTGCCVLLHSSGASAAPTEHVLASAGALRTNPHPQRTRLSRCYAQYANRTKILQLVQYRTNVPLRPQARWPPLVMAQRMRQCGWLDLRTALREIMIDLHLG